MTEGYIASEESMMAPAQQGPVWRKAYTIPNGHIHSNTKAWRWFKVTKCIKHRTCTTECGNEDFSKDKFQLEMFLLSKRLLIIQFW